MTSSPILGCPLRELSLPARLRVRGLSSNTIEVTWLGSWPGVGVADRQEGTSHIAVPAAADVMGALSPQCFAVVPAIDCWSARFAWPSAPRQPNGLDRTRCGPAVPQGRCSFPKAA